jgi:two-component system chemotaxis family response regulator WspR
MLASEPDLTFHYCGNSADAIAAAERFGPTVILQDLIMPGVDGLTLVRRYRAIEATRNVPIVVLSTKEDPVVKKDAFTAGANDYLVKLPDKIELVARIRLHSKAYLNQIQRDEAHRSLSESQRQLVVSNSALAERISELQVARDELSRLVSTDALTGLNSRRRWFELAATEFIRYRRYGRPLTFLMADLDFFKRINDTFGHDAGDEVLRQFGGVLGVASRQSDVAGRIGGEEFAVMLPETAADGAEEVARRIVAECRKLDIATPAGQVKLSCSVGIAEATVVDATVEEVLRRADTALYDAKHSGRDGWRSSPGLRVPDAV